MDTLAYSGKCAKMAKETMQAKRELKRDWERD